MQRRQLLIATGAFAGATVVGLPAAAQAPGGKAIRMVVPTLPGGATDAVGRLVSQQLAKDLNQSIIVENKAGAGGGLGTQLVAQADPDGQTLLFTMSGPLTAVPHVNRNLRYRLADLKPIAVVFRAPFLVVVPANSPYKTFADLIAAGQRGTKELPAYGSAGVGAVSHIASEMLNKSAGTAFIHVPYSGTAATLRALLSNDIAWALVTTNDGKATLDSGRIRPLAVLSEKRSPLYPDVPSVAELGIKDLTLDVWWALYAPAATPPATVSQLQAATRKIVTDPAFIAKIKDFGGDVPAGMTTSDAVMHELQKESGEIQKIVRALDLKAE